VQIFIHIYIHINFNTLVHANNAVRIKNIRERLPGQLVRDQPDGIIMMAGSLYI
jgi:hypothetical protein